MPITPPPGTGFEADPVIFGNNVTFQGQAAFAGVATGLKAWLYSYLEPAGTVASSVDGRMSATSTTAALTSGTVYVNALPIDAGAIIRNISLFPTTAEATGTHAWAGIANSAGTVLAVSADNTGAAYFGPVATAVATPLAAPLVAPYSGLYYAFVCVVATTTPVFAAAPALTHANIPGIAPVLCGSTLTGQTTPVAVGSALGAITGIAGMQFYTWMT